MPSLDDRKMLMVVIGIAVLASMYFVFFRKDGFDDYDYYEDEDYEDGAYEDNESDGVSDEELNSDADDDDDMEDDWEDAEVSSVAYDENN